MICTKVHTGNYKGEGEKSGPDKVYIKGIRGRDSVPDRREYTEAE